MIVKCEGDIEGLIRTFELNVLKRTPDGYHLRVSGEEQAVVAIRQVGDFPAHVASWDNGQD